MNESGLTTDSDQNETRTACQTCHPRLSGKQAKFGQKVSSMSSSHGKAHDLLVDWQMSGIAKIDSSIGSVLKLDWS